jgi:phosphoenolpyruvate synthase/pyruvate phosphate dikinase
VIIGLDHPAALDPRRAGAKAAALARASQSGVPVLPGFVVAASASAEHMGMGRAALESRGSGGARLAVSSQPPPAAAQLKGAGENLSSALVVRSSSPIEGEGSWAGAFTSYMGVSPEELPKAVVGCWASAFSVDALDRARRAGIEPGSVPMAVLVQPAINPITSGVAEVGLDGTIRVDAVAGSPAPLLSGWARGAVATCHPGEGWEGAEAIALIGIETLGQLGSILNTARHSHGYNRCEWGVAGSLWILQLGTVAAPLFTAETLLSPHPGRTGVGNPLAAAAALLEQGSKTQGMPASPGIGVGIRHHFAAGRKLGPPGAIITASAAFPDLSQLIWNAAGLVTDLGSPAAHVFEAARSLHVPAVCGVDLGSESDQIVAVNGSTGVVAVVPLGLI